MNSKSMIVNELGIDKRSIGKSFRKENNYNLDNFIKLH